MLVRACSYASCRLDFVIRIVSFRPSHGPRLLVRKKKGKSKVLWFQGNSQLEVYSLWTFAFPLLWMGLSQAFLLLICLQSYHSPLCVYCSYLVYFLSKMVIRFLFNFWTRLYSLGTLWITYLLFLIFASRDYCLAPCSGLHVRWLLPPDVILAAIWGLAFLCGSIVHSYDWNMGPWGTETCFGNKPRIA